MKNFDNHRSSVSIKATPYSRITESHLNSHIEAANNDNSNSKSSKHQRANAHDRDVRSVRRSLVANYKPTAIKKPAFGVNSSQNSDAMSYIEARMKTKRK